MMMNALALFALIAVFAWIFVLLDWMGRRKDRRTRRKTAH